MKKQIIAALLGTLALTLSACGSGGSGGIADDAIQGKVTRQGGSAQGATVVACNTADDCATGGVGEATANGDYRIGGLRPGQKYVVIAFLDTNGDQQPDLGGIYGGQNPIEVSPPKGGVDIALQPVTSQHLRAQRHPGGG